MSTDVNRLATRLGWSLVAALLAVSVHAEEPGKAKQDIKRRASSTKPRYELVQDFPYEPLSEICVPYTAMLNAFSPKEPLMQCEQKLHSAYPQFQPIPMQELPSADNFKYFNAIRDYEIRKTVAQGGQVPPQTEALRQQLYQSLGGLAGYKYYFVTTDKFIKNKTIILLIQEKQGDCRSNQFDPQRVAFEWDAAAQAVIERRFAFQSLFTYHGKMLEWPGLFSNYWYGGTLTAKPQGKFGSIWLHQATGSGGISHSCSIAFTVKP